MMAKKQQTPRKTPSPQVILIGRRVGIITSAECGHSATVIPEASQRISSQSRKREKKERKKTGGMKKKQTHEAKMSFVSMSRRNGHASSPFPQLQHSQDAFYEKIHTQPAASSPFATKIQYQTTEPSSQPLFFLFSSMSGPSSDGLRGSK